MFSHPQYTLASRLEFDGVGLHSGRPSHLSIRPTDEPGIVFIREGQRTVADLAEVSCTMRCTTLGHDDAEVSTVEHLLAALSAFGVTGAKIHVDGPEVPILDGSAAQFVAAFGCAGLKPLPGARKTLRIAEPVWLEEGPCSLMAAPAEHFRVTAAISFEHPLVGRQLADVVVGPEAFERDVAPARTFGFEKELEELERRGLAKGGDLNNAVVFFDNGTSSPMRFADEPVRHKALDIIGDLALLGAWPMIHVFAVRSSHRLNVKFAGLLRELGTIE